ncbi:hypothetical protein GCK72_016538 [Caenorhabditis remanei]|uniref:Uncharacterized protein n=1 Tax=Caenorhabditis remanei TaxID=31234 RepID=A0A6A5G5A9_CAERE|nr:hypothetical protein GCK72_016538 [Caenorhabditis remanei]KAF1749993.1 hypothetical protein GCK72_016538 [Caenorhabditis remanei]
MIRSQPENCCLQIRVWAELEGEFVSLPHPDSGDGGVVVSSEKDHGCESVLLKLLQSLVHSVDKITAHESKSEIFWVLVLALPDRPGLGVEVLPEVWDGLGGGVFVGDFLHGWLVDNSSEPTSDVDDRLSGASVEDVLKSWEEIKSDGNISKGKTLSNQIGLLDENAVENLELSIEFILVVLNSLLIEVSGRYGWEDVSENSWEKVSLGELKPLNGFGVGGSSGQVKSDGLSSEEKSISLECWGLKF